jgi:glucan phosphoethanolaminetransferase (alkaline phosphatase superfamily)
MRNAKLVDDYISWVRKDFVYKYVLELFFPIYLLNLVLWYSLSFIGQKPLVITTYCGYLLFSIIWISKVFWLPKKKSVLKPLSVSLLLLLFSVFPLYACLESEITGSYSAFFWSSESRKPFSWALFMSGGFGVVYLGVSYSRAAYLNLKHSNQE